MPSVQPADLPASALLARYRDAGAYTDCYAVDVAHAVAFPAYVAAFYTAPVFRLERWILAVLARRPSTDADARELAAGTRDRFSAWRVEGREAGQLLLREDSGRTRSWLMAQPQPGGGTRLYFGSAVVPVAGRNGRRRMGLLFTALLGFHRVYSRVLLAGARSRVGAAAG